MATYDKKKDRNHNDLAKGLKQAGYKVQDCSRFGSGFPDMVVVSPAGRVFLVEAKVPDDFSFTEAEIQWMLSISPASYIVGFTKEQVITTLRQLEGL